MNTLSIVTLTAAWTLMFATLIVFFLAGLFFSKRYSLTAGGIEGWCAVSAIVVIYFDPSASTWAWWTFGVATLFGAFMTLMGFAAGEN